MNVSIEQFLPDALKNDSIGASLKLYFHSLLDFVYGKIPMHIAKPLSLLLALGLTHSAFAGDPTLTLGHHRKKAFEEAFENLAAKEAARCLQKGQGNSEICTRSAIQMRMEKEKEKQAEFNARINPKEGKLREYRAKEAAADRAADRATVGSSVVVLHSRSDVLAQSQSRPAPSQPRPNQPQSRPSQGPRSRM